MIFRLTREDFDIVGNTETESQGSAPLGCFSSEWRALEAMKADLREVLDPAKMGWTTEENKTWREQLFESISTEEGAAAILGKPKKQGKSHVNPFPSTLYPCSGYMFSYTISEEPLDGK